MKAVFDTSPLSYLVLIGEVQIVPLLFSEIFIPQAVAVELGHPGAPEALRSWMARAPDWLEVRSVEPRADPRLRLLHAGEREAILLAQQHRADWIVIDELAGRRVASSMDLKVTGLLGLLGKAAQRQMIDLPKAIERLRQTRFRVSERLLKEILDHSE